MEVDNTDGSVSITYDPDDKASCKQLVLRVIHYATKNRTPEQIATYATAAFLKVACDEGYDEEELDEVDIRGRFSIGGTTPEQIAETFLAIEASLPPPIANVTRIIAGG